MAVALLRPSSAELDDAGLAAASNRADEHSGENRGRLRDALRTLRVIRARHVALSDVSYLVADDAGQLRLIA